MICNACGQWVTIGQWPFCPHGTPRGDIIRDEIPGGQVIEHLGHEPMTFYSQKAIRDAADKRGLRLVDKWLGPADRHLTNWGAAIDAQTLDNARALVTRGSLGHAQDADATIAVTTSVRVLKQLSEGE